MFDIPKSKMSFSMFGIAASQNIYEKLAAELVFDKDCDGYIWVKHVSNPPKHNIGDFSVSGK